MEKVYCKSSKYMISHPELSEARCKATIEKKEEGEKFYWYAEWMEYEDIIIHSLCREENKDNDCSLYRKKRWKFI